VDNVANKRRQTTTVTAAGLITPCCRLIADGCGWMWGSTDTYMEVGGAEGQVLART